MNFCYESLVFCEEAYLGGAVRRSVCPSIGWLVGP